MNDIIEKYWEFYLYSIEGHFGHEDYYGYLPEVWLSLGLNYSDDFTSEQCLAEIEDIIQIPEQMADDFRRKVAEFIGRRAIKGKSISFECSAEFGPEGNELSYAIIKFYCRRLFTDFALPVLRYNDRTVLSVATLIDEGEVEKRPILADALEDAGYNDEKVLNHLRNHNHKECRIVSMIVNLAKS